MNESLNQHPRVGRMRDARKNAGAERRARSPDRGVETVIGAGLRVSD